MADNTFLGLQPYTEDDAYRFKGRTEESQELFRLIVRNDFTVCYAESGEGKTSLLNAGVFPLLRENMYFPIAITFTSDDYKVTPNSFDAIIDRCIKDSIAEYNEKNKGVNVEYKLCSTDFLGLDNQAELQQELSKFSWWKLRNYRPQAMGLTFTPVFVFDQFEEVFNLPGSNVWTKKFFDWLENVSSDSCPEDIAKKVREIIGDKAAFPTIKEEKDFKAVFSLRKEFIGELDYWGMQTHFIPALKDNRYCLKPLTYEGAKKVMTQQERFDEDKVEQVLNYFVKKYSREPKRTIEEDLPVIPALLLSVVGNSWEKNSQYFIEEDDNSIENSLSNILAQFYDNTIEKIVHDFVCEWNEKSKTIAKSSPWYGIQGLEEGGYRREIEEILFLLVDRNGKRERTKTTSSRFSKIGFDEKYKNTLCDNRIIKVTKVDGEDYVEIVHDSLCPIIAKRKEERFAAETKEREENNRKEIEETKKREEQRVNVTSFTLLSLVSIFIIWFISAVFQNSETLRSLISEVSITDSLTTYGISPFRMGVFGTSLVNLLIIPVLIYSSVKRMKITFWLSVYGLISNLLLMSLFIVGQDSSMSLRWAFAVIILLVPTITLFYSIKERIYGVPEKQEIWAIVKSAPLKYFCLFISLYLFYLCVFNRVLGLAEPIDSSWGVFVIPLLVHEIIRNAMGQKQNKIVLIVLCCLLGLLTYNTSVVPFALPSYTVIGVMIVFGLSLLWAYKDQTLWKKATGVAMEIFILTGVVILNIGFNVAKVNYDKVSHVFNWVDVMVYDDENMVGVVSACQGDTILPCRFDSIDYRHRYAFLNSNRIHYQKDIIDYKGLYSYKQNTDSALWQCLFIDEVENNISQYRNKLPDALRDDSIRVYAARVYHEVRNANIGYFNSGRMYSLSNIGSLDKLVKLQNQELSELLKQISNSATSTYVRPIDVVQVTEFNKTFARSFYLCMLKDRIVRKDSVNIFNLTQEIITLYFPDAGFYELTTNFNNNFNMGGFHKTFSSTFRASELRSNTLDSWYNYVIMLLAMGMGANAENYVNTKVERYTDIIGNIQSIHDRMNQENKRNLQRMSKLLQNSDKLDLDDIKEALDIYKKQLDFTNEIKGQTNIQIDRIDVERQMDLDFQKLINDVFSTLSNIVSNSQNIYNSEFVDICEQLYLISVLRQYEIAPIYLQYLEQMDQKKTFYLEFKKEFKKMQEQEDSLKKMVKSFRF